MKKVYYTTFLFLAFLGFAWANNQGESDELRISKLILSGEEKLSFDEYKKLAKSDNSWNSPSWYTSGNSPDWMTAGNSPDWYTSSNSPDWYTARNSPDWYTAGNSPDWYTGSSTVDPKGKPPLPKVI